MSHKRFLVALLALAGTGCNLVLGIGELTNTGTSSGSGGAGGSSSTTTTSATSTTGTGGAATSSSTTTTGTGGNGGTGGTPPSTSPIGCGATCVAGDPIWAERFGGAANDTGSSIAVASNGDVFVAGYLGSTVDLGGGDINSGCFLMKLSGSGQHQWSLSLGSNCQGITLAVGADNQPVIAGVYKSGLSIHNTTYLGNGGFVAKLSNGGLYQWTRGFQLGAGGLFEMNAVAVAPNNAVAIAGSWSGTVNVGNGMETTGSGGQNVFVVRIDGGTGATQWAKTYSAGGNNICRASAVTFPSSGGELVFTGRMMSKIDFGTGLLPNADGMFLVRLNSSGTTTNATSFTGARGLSIAHDAQGSVAVAGGIDTPTSNFGGTDVPKGGFVAKFGNTLTHVFSKSLSGLTEGAVAFDGAGDVFVTGHFTGTINFGQSLISNGDADIVVGKLGGAAGGYLWSRHYGGPGTDQGRSIAVDGTGAPLITGSMSTGADFGVGKLEPAGGYDVLVARLQP